MSEWDRSRSFTCTICGVPCRQQRRFGGTTMTWVHTTPAGRDLDWVEEQLKPFGEHVATPDAGEVARWALAR